METGELEALRTAALAGHVGGAAVARALVRDRHPAVRAAALGALSRLSDDTLGPTLLNALADTEPAVRRRAAELSATVATIPITALAALLDDPDHLVAEAACWALGEREDPTPVEALVVTAAGHGDPLVREAAVAALGAIGDERGLPAVLAATTDKTAVRRRAVLALAPFEGPEVGLALQRALEDRDWQVRQAAEDLLA